MKRLLNFNIAVLGLMVSLDCFALPASARLFQQNYGYKTSCLLCHADGGGTVSNKYGKAFLRAGANSSAFKKLELQDSDDDGITNLVEIIARSNPGDKQSTPANLGDWLANASKLYIPQKELENLFPTFSKFSAIEGSLNEKQITFLKSKLGSDLQDDDKVPTFYFAEKEGVRHAVGQFVSQHLGESRGLNVGVALSTNGKILHVEILGGSEAKAAMAQLSYINGLKAKGVADLSEPSDATAKLVFSAVRRSMYLISAVFGGGA